MFRKFRHPTHYKEHVKKHGEAVQFACELCEVNQRDWFKFSQPYRSGMT
jgi:hypothetical protein